MEGRIIVRGECVGTRVPLSLRIRRTPRGSFYVRERSGGACTTRLPPSRVFEKSVGLICGGSIGFLEISEKLVCACLFRTWTHRPRGVSEIPGSFGKRRAEAESDINFASLQRIRRETMHGDLFPGTMKTYEISPDLQFHRSYLISSG